MSLPPQPSVSLTSVLGASGAFSASVWLRSPQRLRPAQAQAARPVLARPAVSRPSPPRRSLPRARRAPSPPPRASPPGPWRRWQARAAARASALRSVLQLSAQQRRAPGGRVRPQSQVRPWRSATALASAPVSNRQAASRPSARQPPAWQVLSPSLRRCFPPLPARVEPLDRRHDRRFAVRRARRRSATDRLAPPASAPLSVISMVRPRA